MVLHVEDTLGVVATVSLDLALESGVEVPLPVVEYERGYKPKPLTGRPRDLAECAS